MTTKLNVRLSDGTYEGLKWVADEYGITINSLICHALYSFLTDYAMNHKPVFNAAEDRAGAIRATASQPDFST